MAIIFVYNFVSDSPTNEIAQNNSSNFIVKESRETLARYW